MLLKGHQKGTKFLPNNGLGEFLRGKMPGKWDNGACGDVARCPGSELLIRGSGVRIPSGVPRNCQLKALILSLKLVIFCLYDFERHQKGTKTGKNFCSSAETL